MSCAGGVLNDIFNEIVQIALEGEALYIPTNPRITTSEKTKDSIRQGQSPVDALEELNQYDSIRIN